ncbi:MAG: hypothetical protein WC758_06840 [Candidatus Woesearchaeota archaeon]|jgi:hypothetical protein
MNLPDLDIMLKNTLNSLTLENLKFGTDVNHGFNHGLLLYGVEAITHNYLMQKAEDVSAGKLSKGEFIQKYNLGFLTDGKDIGLEFAIKKYGFFVAPINTLESEGIFIPKQADWNILGEKLNKKVNLFGLDYTNLIYRDNWTNKDYALSLIHRKWQPEDLENPELVEQGIKFGEDMWKTCVAEFNEYKHRQSASITDLGQKLIDYYSKIVFTK